MTTPTTEQDRAIIRRALDVTCPNGNYAMWRDGNRWSLYRDSDGALALHAFCSEEQAKSEALLWCLEVLDGGSHV